MQFLSTFAQLIEDPNKLGLPDVSADDSFFRDTVVPTAAVVATFSLIIWIIIGGFRYVVAAGNPEQVQKAKNTILYGVIGLFVVFFAVTIVNFVVSSL